MPWRIVDAMKRSTAIGRLVSLAKDVTAEVSEFGVPGDLVELWAAGSVLDPDVDVARQSVYDRNATGWYPRRTPFQGLQPGQWIAVAGVDQLRQGQKIKILEPGKLM